MSVALLVAAEFSLKARTDDRMLPMIHPYFGFETPRLFASGVVPSRGLTFWRISGFHRRLARRRCCTAELPTFDRWLTLGASSVRRSRSATTRFSLR